jgi:hypothetical protein
MAIEFFIPKVSVNELQTDIPKMLQKYIGQKDWIVLEWRDDICDIIIQKGGNSTITLTCTQQTGGVLVQETNKKLAFLHKAFYPQVITILSSIVKDLGGTLDSQA